MTAASGLFWPNGELSVSAAVLSGPMEDDSHKLHELF
jgi:hypothetical protein